MSRVLFKPRYAPVPKKRSEKLDVPEEQSSVILLGSLWVFSSIFSVTKLDFNSNITGISLAFHMQDVAMLAIFAAMLHRGLSTRSISMIFPWMLMSSYGLYLHHRNITRMMKTLKYARHATAIPWFALMITSFGLILKIILIFRILQLAINLWYRKKLEKELYDDEIKMFD